MKFLLAFACILATALASPIYGNAGYGASSVLSNSYLAPAQPIGLYQVQSLAPVAAASYAVPQAVVAPVASYGAVSSGYGAASAIDGQVLQLAKLALHSLPNPAADLSSGYGAPVAIAAPAVAAPY